jgi:saccharopine dehydrogenase-like NADP-dependent oxidoreductase
LIEVAQEVIDSLLLTNKHEIILLSRSVGPDKLRKCALLISFKASQESVEARISHCVVDYKDVKNLACALRGVHTVLSFIQVLLDVGQKSQKNLIDAAIVAGVKRFAPSEYGRLATSTYPW